MSVSVHVSSWCWLHSHASGTDRLVLLAIADMANDDGEDAWPSYPTLATRCLVSEKTIQRSIQRLAELGELGVERMGGPVGRGRTNQRPNKYRFPAYQAFRKGSHPVPPSPPGSSQADPSYPVGSSQSDYPYPVETRQIDLPSDPERVDTTGQRVDTAVTSYPSLDPSLEPDSTSKSTSKKTSKTAARSRRDQVPRPDVDQLCELLHAELVGNKVLHTVGEKWRTAARLLLDRDQRPLDEAIELIGWATHHRFWTSTIHCMPSFRKQYDKLRIQKQNENGRGHLKAVSNGYKPYSDPPDPSIYHQAIR